LCKKIALNLSLSIEEIKLLELIGLLHDIGRFEQVRQFDTFNDAISVNHGILGIKMLFEHQLIRKFINDTKYDEIIKQVILNHNVNSITISSNEKINLYSKILRDADKLDILYLIAKKQVEYNFVNYNINPEIKNSILNKAPAKITSIRSGIDELFVHLCYLYDINFNYSIKILKRKKYINKIERNLKIKDKNIKMFFQIIKKDLVDYKAKN
jgi:HD superfamily phosphodiesterase